MRPGCSVHMAEGKDVLVFFENVGKRWLVVVAVVV